MIAFEVSRNGKVLCTAGVGDVGTLCAVATFVGYPHEHKQLDSDVLKLTVGGVLTNVDQKLSWAVVPLATGDEIQIRVLDLPEVDEPQRVDFVDCM